MKLTTTVTTGALVPLLQLYFVLQFSVPTNGNVLSKKVVPTCESGCHCLGSEGNCPSYPTVTESMLPTYRALNYANPMDIDVACDPFQSSTCVSTLEQGEACVVELIAPKANQNSTENSSCPSGTSYRLRTVPSIENAIVARQYITHTGACGTCSSLQDFALMIEYPNLPYKGQQCFFRSTALKYVEKAITCYEEVGFTRSCATTLAYHQKTIVDKECGYQCAAWGYDGDLGRPSCEDVSGCGACVDGLGITAQLELLAGRTFANSGYPSQKAQQCSNITSVDTIGGSDICNEAPVIQVSNEASPLSTAPSISPAVSGTASPSTQQDQFPTISPSTPASILPTEASIASPIEPPESPADNGTVAPVGTTESPVLTITSSPTPSRPPTSVFLYQDCMSKAAIEIRAGALENGVFCDCSEAESGKTNRPRCYSSPDRDDSSRCSAIFESCGPTRRCCGNARHCRSGVCRSGSSRAGSTNRDKLRLSSTRGGAGNRRDRNERGASTLSTGNGTREGFHRGRIRRRA